jgi:hypothetical protein
MRPIYWPPSRSASSSANLQTLTEIGVEKNTTIVFPLPLNILEDLSRVLERATESTRPKAVPSS